MNENEFRKRLNDALGETPAMAPPVLSKPAASASGVQPRLAAIVAFVLAVLLVVVLVATRISFHPTGSIQPAGKSGPSPLQQVAADSFPCALPVVAVSEAGNPGQPGQTVATAGFINIPDGTYQVDPSATVRGLPAPAGFSNPTIYSPALKRWLPASSQNISPDLRSYAYATFLPAGATYRNFTSMELHVYDATAHSDRKVWSAKDFITVAAWRDTGILVNTVPKQGGVQLWWLVDPIRGTVAQQPANAPVPFLFQGTAFADYHNFSPLGSDPSGQRSVYRLGSRDQGTKYAVVVVDNGDITTIYTGTAGDAKDFDPEHPYFDAHGLWFGNFDGSVVWLWTANGGLRSFGVHGGPGPAPGYQFNNQTYLPAGPCVPGVFSGVRASPLPAATTPTPSPSPPAVDWSALQSRPLQIPQLSPGASCPVSTSVSLDVKAQNGKWPNYGFGPGPAYISGQVMWYSAGSQAILILVDPKYKGPVLIRAQRIDGSGTVQMSGDGLQPLTDGYGLPQTSSPPYWGTWFGAITPSTPGCYAIQLDGTSFTAVVVIQVKQGPPPPG